MRVQGGHGGLDSAEVGFLDWWLDLPLLTAKLLAGLTPI